MGVISSLSTLGYSLDMPEGLMASARGGRAVPIAKLAMAGSTGPMTLAGCLAP